MPSTVPAPLQANAIHLWRGEKHLLRGVSFSLNAGELLQVVGPNGVGKTSLLRCLAGLLPMESGDVFWQGQPVERVREEFHQQLGWLAHVNALKADLTAAENLYFATALRREVAEAEVQEVLQRLHIPHCADLPVRSLSAGQKRRVALARVLLTKATLWILDEPITNLDKAGIAVVEACMADHLAGSGMIIAAAHQNLLAGHSGVRDLELR